MLAFSFDAQATHNRSGEITYTQIGPLTIRATITTYTKASSTSVDRDTLTINWGDGTSEAIARSNGNGEGEVIPGEDIKVNLYISEHTYPGRSTYTLSFADPNRVNNIQNVNFPYSVEVPFYVETTFTFLNSQFQGFNSSIVLLQPPIDFACVGSRFIHNPNAYDPDGDSLSYELVVPFQAEGEEVPQYEFPDQIVPGPDNNISLDPVTGDFVWNSPKSPGEYNIAIQINEFRNGVLLNSVIRDMQIFVDVCANRPPSIETEEEICVIAGERIELPIEIDDPDTNQQVRLFATGGPFFVPTSKAILSGNEEYNDVRRTETFVWQTQCEHISDNYYQVVFRAQDDFNSTSSGGLAILKTVRIKVVGPPPEDLSAEINEDEHVRVAWKTPYDCEDAEDDYFIGFSVWRKESSQPVVLDSCDTGLDGLGYVPIVFLTNQSDNDEYFIIDSTIVRSKIYCYRVLANFANRTPSGNPFNIVESIPSEEVCLQIKQDVPVITNVSVLNTSNTDGSIEVKWIKPNAVDLDTLENAGPYRYEILRSTDGVTFSQVSSGEFASQSFAEEIDLTFIDSNLDTRSNQYYYQIEFYADDLLFSLSEPASSIFLNIDASDAVNILSWDEDTPWVNYSYKIFREDDLGSLVEIGNSTNQNYEDTEVLNDINYCYIVESEGTYGLNGIPSPLFNASQEVCSTPIDTVGPCTPNLTIESPCDLLNSGIELQEIFNTLSWNTINLDCENSDDWVSVRIYFSDDENTDLELLSELDLSINELEHRPGIDIAGCYAISAVDSLGNEGPLSELICVESCPIYKLPNTFTPNADGSNDLFVPIEKRFVAEVDFKVFNRWGNLVFETTDPSIEWNGENPSGNNLDAGTYYYTCKIFDQENTGQPEIDFLSGYIQIFR